MLLRERARPLVPLTEPKVGVARRVVKEPPWRAIQRALRRELEGPLVVPDTKTEGVEVKGPSGAPRTRSRHRDLIGRHDHAAGIADLSVAFTADHCPKSAVWETTVLESSPDDGRNEVEIDHGRHFSP